MNTRSPTNPSKRHRCPAESIRHGVGLYCRCCLRDREVDALMAARGILLTYEAVRYGGRKCGQA